MNGPVDLSKTCCRSNQNSAAGESYLPDYWEIGLRFGGVVVKSESNHEHMN